MITASEPTSPSGPAPATPSAESASAVSRSFTALTRVTSACRWVAACVVIVLMLITGFDVVMRYALARPLEWSITLSMVGLIAIVILAVPDLEARDEHIGMDLFYRSFSPRRKAIADWVTFTATFGFCLVAGIAAARTTLHFAQANLLTAGTFNIPIWVGYALLTLGLLLTALTTLLRFMTQRARGRGEAGISGTAGTAATAEQNREA
ncbi:TRAP transporter small permease [Brevibacterium album]|uniref:TRAP transporter small permease n=1 Tax=Brevibacterium album TaxID=417948 RepID=UPI00040E3762|nr:TRAP transporter small permease [Brevibacterium album]